jgi:hypothetical protein
MNWYDSPRVFLYSVLGIATLMLVSWALVPA